jgi:rubredoxin
MVLARCQLCDCLYHFHHSHEAVGQPPLFLFIGVPFLSLSKTGLYMCSVCGIFIYSG